MEYPVSNSYPTKENKPRPSLVYNVCTDCGKLTYIENGRCRSCEASHSTEGLGMMLLIVMGVLLGSMCVLGLMIYSK